MNKKRTAFVCLTLAIVLMLSVTFTGCQPSSQSEGDQQLISLGAEPIIFAPYREVPVTLKPAVEAYKVAEDLSNIINKDLFDFSAEAQNLLVKNGFVVVPSSWREFFSIYEVNRYNSIPNFITTDAMMHNYHLYFSHLLRTLEKHLEIRIRYPDRIHAHQKPNAVQGIERNRLGKCSQTQCRVSLC